MLSGMATGMAGGLLGDLLGQVAVGIGFVVTIDDMKLGSFNSCEGLGCEFVIEQREEGGNNSAVWQLPTRIKYSNVKLSRPVTPMSPQVLEWFTSMASGVKRKTAIIEAHGPGRIPIAAWGLLDVIPVRWSGPSLNPENPKIATETIELAHHGFFGPTTGGGLP